MRVPRWKLMSCIGLERFVKLLVIQAPKRNSKFHNEMWTEMKGTQCNAGMKDTGMKDPHCNASPSRRLDRQAFALVIFIDDR
jgi:hypothetical protein